MRARPYWLIVLFAALICAGVGCGRYGFERVYGESEIFGLIETSTNKAIESKSPTSCEGLPETANYESRGPNNVSMGRSGMWPRSECYRRYVQETKDPAACVALEHTSAKSYTNFDCYDFLAQASNDISLCDQAGPARAECRALVMKDVAPCYDVGKLDEVDVSKYSRSVQWCIGEVARKAPDFDLCLIIDGPDYGDQWRVGRNQCIELVAATLGLKSGELNAACQKMVDDEPGWDIKQQCLQGKVTKLGPGFE